MIHTCILTMHSMSIAYKPPPLSSNHSFTDNKPAPGVTLSNGAGAYIGLQTNGNCKKLIFSVSATVVYRTEGMLLMPLHPCRCGMVFRAPRTRLCLAALSPH